MQADQGAAQARQFVRKETRRAARIEVDSDHAEQFRLTFPDSQSGLYVVDVSRGGLGLSSGFYIPRNLRMILHISGTDEATSEKTRELAVRLICRRCILTDHKPTFLVGLQYVNPSGTDERELIEAVRDRSQGLGVMDQGSSLSPESHARIPDAKGLSVRVAGSNRRAGLSRAPGGPIERVDGLSDAEWCLARLPVWPP